jgi:glycosyltransferase involved in cell wall biosynthesis
VAIDWIRSRIPTRIIVSGAWVERTLIREWKYPRGAFRQVAYGVRMPGGELPPGARETTRAAWGVPGPALLFGTLGRTESRMKGLDRLLDAFATLPAEHEGVPVHLAIIGRGPDREALRSHSRELGLGTRAHFVEYQDEALPAYQALDIFVIASRYEAGPLTLLEAMATARPCITTDVGLAAEAVPDQSFGWRVPADSAGALAEAMSAAMTSTEADRSAIGQRARQWVKGHFEEEERMDSLVSILMGPA